MRISDWSSDVCSSGLPEIVAEFEAAHAQGLDVARVHSGDPSLYGAIREQMRRLDALGIPYDVTPGVPAFAAAAAALKRELTLRSEERRVGTECVNTVRSRWSRDHKKKKTTKKN